MYSSTVILEEKYVTSVAVKAGTLTPRCRAIIKKKKTIKYILKKESRRKEIKNIDLNLGPPV